MHGPCRPVTTAVIMLLICSTSAATYSAADFLPADEDGLLTNLIAPHSAEEFMSKFYEKATFRVARNDAEYFAWLRAETFDKLDEVVDIFKRDNSLTKGIQLKVNGETRNVPTNLTGGCLRRIMQEGSGALVRFEKLKRVKVPAMEMLAYRYRAALGFDTTLHLYMGLKEGSRALAPHTDPYDVMVLQLYGSKEWTTCVPKPSKMIPKGVDMHEAYSDADLCQLQEIEIKRQRGCTSYSDVDLSRMSCKHNTLKAGDTLYMPKGVIHFARTGAEGSAHLTMSLERDGANWVDVLAAAAAEYTAPKAEEFIQALTELTGMTEGLPLLQAFPMWVVSRAPLAGMQTSQATRCRLQGSTTLETGPNCWSRLREMYRVRVALLQKHLARRHEKSRPSAAVPWTARQHIVHLASAVLDDVTLDHVLAKLEAGEKLTSYDIVLKQDKARQRRATDYADRTCTSGCDATCSYTTGCDDECDGPLSCGCDSYCDLGCDYACDSSCNTYLCTTGCDSSCDGLSSNGSCNAGCDDSCGFWSCDSDCNSGCDYGCDGSCDYSCTSCDNGCDDGRVCDSSCDDGCQCNPGYAGDASGNACRYCSGGFYAPSAGLTSCVQCPTCSSNYHNYGCGGTSGGSCHLCESCGAGFYRKGCSGYSNGSCEACPSNTYSDVADAAPACKSCQACSSGYQHIGCGGASEGYCRGVPCTGEGSLAAGSVSKSNGGRYPSNATYRCDNGYTLSGTLQRSCSTNGSYRDTVPVCVGIVCTSLSSFNGVASTTNDGRYPAIATFSCPAGYQLSGSSILTCGTDGQWSSAIPKCNPMPCIALDTLCNAFEICIGVFSNYSCCTRNGSCISYAEAQQRNAGSGADRINASLIAGVAITAAVAVTAMIAYGVHRKRRVRRSDSPFKTNDVAHVARYSSNTPSTPARRPSPVRAKYVMRQLPQEAGPGTSGMQRSHIEEEEYITEPRYVSVSIASGSRASSAPLADACYAIPLDPSDLIYADCGRISASDDESSTTRFKSCEGGMIENPVYAHLGSTGQLNPVRGLRIAESAVEANRPSRHFALADNPVYDSSHVESSSL